MTDVPYWNAIGGVGSIAMGLYSFTIDLPGALWWAPWAGCAGGVLLLASAGLSALFER